MLPDDREMNTARKTFLNVSSFQVLVMFRRGLFYSYLSIYLRFFLGLSVTETTLFATFSMIVNVVFQSFVWGRVSDKLQLRRTLIIIGEILAAIITFLVWVIHTIPDSTRVAGWAIIVGMSVVEIFWSMSNLGWTALLSDLYPEKERAGLQGKLQSVGAIGRIVGVWIGGVLYDGLSQHYDGWGFDQGSLFFIASGVMLISSIPMFFVPEGGVASKPVTGDASLKDLKRSSDNNSGMSKQFLLFLLAMLFYNFGLNSVTLLKSQYLTLADGFNVSSHTLSYILNMGSVAMFAIGLAVKRLSDRFTDESLLITSTLLAIVHLFIFVFAERLLTIYASEAIGGIARGLGMASAYAYVSRLIPASKRGRLFAWFNATMFLSWGLPGTIITGPLADYLIASGHTQAFSYQMTFLTASAMVLVSTAVLLYLAKIGRGELPGEE